MKTVDSLHLALDRIPQPMRDKRGAVGRPRAVAAALFDLWNDEYGSWQALHRVGLEDAARCAWQRRSAAAEAHILLIAAM